MATRDDLCDVVGESIADATAEELFRSLGELWEKFQGVVGPLKEVFNALPSSVDLVEVVLQTDEG